MPSNTVLLNDTWAFSEVYSAVPPNEAPALDQGNNPVFVSHAIAAGTPVEGLPYKLAEELDIRVWYEGSTVSVTSTEIPMSGRGASVVAAVRDLLKSLAEMLEVLRDQREFLAPRIAMQLSRLEALLQATSTGQA